MSLAQRISDTQTAFTTKKDELKELWANADQTDVSDAELAKANKLNAEIVALESQLEALNVSERLLASTVDGGHGGNGSTHRALVTSTAFTQPNKIANGGGAVTSITSPAVIAKRHKELDPVDYIVRAGRIAYGAKIWGKPADVVRMSEYGDDEGTRVVTELLLRAASAPAMTTVTGWALELVQQIYTDLMPLLMPAAVLTRLSARGLSLSFGSAGKIVIPTRSRTPTIAGSFVAEGGAIPVRQGAFTSQTLVPKKLAVITTWTREMSDHSTPQIEGVLREAVQQDTGVAVDTVLLDANPATTVRPPGLLNGVAATTATAGGGIAALIGDIKALQGALTTNTYGNVRSPTWLMNPTDMLAASLLQAANTGIFPFRDEIRNKTLNTIPIIDSSTVTAKTMILVDAADFVVVGQEAPRFELSDQATLHFEDTNPADLVSGSPGVVATPQKSLWQTDSIALRLVWPMNWVMRRAGNVVWTSNVSWA
jgi:HK97 family phage major capsid protein